MNVQQPPLVEKYFEELKRGVVPYLNLDEYEEIIAFFEELEEFAEAIRAIDYGLINYPGDEDLLAHKAKNYIYLEKFDRAEHILKSIGEPTDFSLLVWAEYYLSLGDIDSCVESLDQLITQFGSDPMVFLDISDFLSAYEEIELAIDFILKGLDMHSQDKSLLGELALMYEDAEEWEKNIPITNRLIDIDPYNVIYWLLLARSYRGLGDTEKCMDACNYAITIDENNTEAHLIIAEIYYMLSNFEKAYERFMFLVKLNAQSEQSAMLTLAPVCKFRMEQYPEALALVDRAIENNPEYTHAYYMKATLSYMNEEYDEALRLAEKAIEIEPENSEAYFLIGEIYFQQGKSELSLPMTQMAVKIDPYKAFVIYPHLRMDLVSDSYEEVKLGCMKLIHSFPEVLLFKVLFLSHAIKNDDQHVIEMYYDEISTQVAPILQISRDDKKFNSILLDEIIQSEEAFTDSLRTERNK
ncbi:hypothetical protein MASR1M31_09980 [Porphyromonadaceae bacterium]